MAVVVARALPRHRPAGPALRCVGLWALSRHSAHERMLPHRRRISVLAALVIGTKGNPKLTRTVQSIGVTQSAVRFGWNQVIDIVQQIVILFAHGLVR